MELNGCNYLKEKFWFYAWCYLLLTSIAFLWMENFIYCHHSDKDMHMSLVGCGIQSYKLTKYAEFTNKCCIYVI